MDVQQEIYQKIFRAFNEKGIEFAYPTQKIYAAQDVPLRITSVSDLPDGEKPNMQIPAGSEARLP
jgi:small-conductance mechanosensitive channel